MYYVFKLSGILLSQPPFGQATFQVLYSRTWLVAAILDSAALDAICLLSYLLVVHLPGMREDTGPDIPTLICLVALTYLGHVILISFSRFYLYWILSVNQCTISVWYTFCMFSSVYDMSELE